MTELHSLGQVEILQNSEQKIDNFIDHKPLGDPLLYSVNIINYDPLILSYLCTRYGFFKQICDQIDIELPIKYFYNYTLDEIAKYKIDCLTDYVIYMQSNENIICINQNYPHNMFNINDLMPCQIIYMRIHFLSFQQLFISSDIDIVNLLNLSSYKDITNEYITNLKINIKIIIQFILSKLNYNKTDNDIKPILSKITTILYPNELLSMNNEEFILNSEEEKKNWIGTIKKYLSFSFEPHEKLQKIKNIKYLYNFIHKYIHITIKNKNFLETNLNKINDLLKAVNETIYTNIKLLSNTNSQNNINLEFNSNILICLSAINSMLKVHMLIKDINQTNLIYRI